MNVCVTGGSGFVGQKLVDNLLATGCDIKLLTRKYTIDTERKKYFFADLTDKDSVLTGLFENIDIVYHCAGEISKIDSMYALHVEGTERLLKEVRRQIRITKTPIHWVQLSSVGAYGPPLISANEERIVTEENPCKPHGEYEVTKTLADNLVVEMAATEPLFSYTILRPSNVIGALMPNQSLRALVEMVRKRLFFYIGSRSAISTYIHVDDVISALMICGVDKRAHGHVFNLSNDCPLSQIVNAVAQMYDLSIPKICLPENFLRQIVRMLVRTNEFPLTQARIDALVKHTYYPFTKIEKTLGFAPQHDIPRSIVTMFS